MKINIERDYNILEDLSSKNSIAKFYLATDQLLNRKVGIKSFPLNSISYKDVINEAKANINLGTVSPFIPQIYEIFKKDNNAYIVFQYISKRSLRTLIDEKKLDCKQAINIVKKIVNILIPIANHFNNINHRDLKPENILFDKDDNLYLIDYGLTFIPPTFNEGTKNYQAPEQVNTGNLKIQNAALDKIDQFALGVILAEMILKRPIIKGRDYTFSTSTLQKEWPLLSDLKKERISNQLITLILKLMSIEAKNRFRNMSEVKQAINKIGVNYYEQNRANNG